MSHLHMATIVWSIVTALLRWESRSLVHWHSFK